MNNLKVLDKYKNIIYDLDGTIAKLVEDWKGWHDKVETLFREFEPDFKREGLVNNLQNDFVKKYGKRLRDKISKMNEIYELENLKEIIPNEELIKYIKVRKNVVNYILTSNNHLLADKVLRDFGIYDKFKKIIARDDVILIKPDLEGVKKIIDGKNCKEFIMVGDTSNDELTARSAGIAFEKIKI